MAASSAAAPAARLVLHFDVNKTLILIDPAGGKTLRHVLNGIIADTAWGTVADAAGDEPPVWTAASDDLSIGRPPAADASTPLTGGRVTSDDGTNLCTYHHFVEEILLPFEPVAGLTGDAKAAAVKANKAIKAVRRRVPWRWHCCCVRWRCLTIVKRQTFTSTVRCYWLRPRNAL